MSDLSRDESVTIVLTRPTSVALMRIGRFGLEVFSCVSREFHVRPKKRETKKQYQSTELFFTSVDYGFQHLKRCGVFWVCTSPDENVVQVCCALLEVKSKWTCTCSVCREAAGWVGKPQHGKGWCARCIKGRHEYQPH